MDSILSKEMSESIGSLKAQKEGMDVIAEVPKGAIEQEIIGDKINISDKTNDTVDAGSLEKKQDESESLTVSTEDNDEHQENSAKEKVNDQHNEVAGGYDDDKQNQNGQKEEKKNDQESNDDDFTNFELQKEEEKKEQEVSEASGDSNKIELQKQSRKEEIENLISKLDGENEKIDKYSSDEIDVDSDEVLSNDNNSQSSSESSSDSEVESGDSSDEESDIILNEGLNDEEDDAIEGPIRSANEIVDEVAPVLPEDYKIDQSTPIDVIGEIYAFAENNLVIKGYNSAEFRVLKENSVLCFENRKPIGLIFEVFGPLQNPFYRVKFNNLDDESRELYKSSKGIKVYYVVSSAEFELTERIKALKGCDASNGNDEEVPENELEFSDDAAEAEYKKAKKNKKKRKLDSNKTKENTIELSRKKQSGNAQTTSYTPLSQVPQQSKPYQPAYTIIQRDTNTSSWSNNVQNNHGLPAIPSFAPKPYGDNVDMNTRPTFYNGNNARPMAYDANNNVRRYDQQGPLKSYHSGVSVDNGPASYNNYQASNTYNVQAHNSQPYNQNQIYKNGSFRNSNTPYMNNNNQFLHSQSSQPSWNPQPQNNDYNQYNQNRNQGMPLQVQQNFQPNVDMQNQAQLLNTLASNPQVAQLVQLALQVNQSQKPISMPSAYNPNVFGNFQQENSNSNNERDYYHANSNNDLSNAPNNNPYGRYQQ